MRTLLPAPAGTEEAPLHAFEHLDLQGPENLLSYINDQPQHREAELQALARRFYPYSRQDEAAVTMTREAFIALCQYLYEDYDECTSLGMPYAIYPTLGRVCWLADSIANDPDTQTFAALRDLACRGFLSEQTRCRLWQLQGMSHARCVPILRGVVDAFSDDVVAVNIRAS